MKRLTNTFLILFVGLFILIGCGNGEEEFESFSLQELGMLPLEDTETPYLYSVNQNDAEDQVIIFRNEKIDIGFSTSEETHDLENVTVTDEEIVIEYDGQVETFKRLSESVAENEDKVQYQYINTSVVQ